MADSSVYTSNITEPLLASSDPHAETGQSILDGNQSFHALDDRLRGSCGSVSGGDNSGHLGYLYEYWNSTGLSSVSNPVPTWGKGDEEKPGGDLDKLKGVDFGAISAAVGKVKGLSAAMTAVGKAGDTLNSGVGNAWKGKAADAATGAIGKISGPSDAYARVLGQLAAHLQGFHDAVRHAVVAIAQSADQNPKLVFGLMLPSEGAPAAQFMRQYGTEDVFNVGDWSRTIDGLKQLQSGDILALRGDDSFGGVALDVLTFGIKGDVEQGSTLINTQSSIGRLNTFAQSYTNVVVGLRALIKSAATDVLERGAHDTLSTFVNQNHSTLANPFDGLAFAAEQQVPPESAPQATRPSSQPSSGYPPPSSGGMGMPVPPSTTPADAQAQAETMRLQPPSPQPHDQQTAPETVKIANGDGSIEISSPNGQGHMKLTVDDGSGKPKTYDIDFGQGSGRPGNTDISGVPPVTPAALSQPSMGHVSPGQDGGPTDSTTQQAGDAQHVQADASGKAVIHDGKETITIEHPQGASNEIKVTVDDGSGKPQTYTMDYSAAEQPVRTVTASAGNSMLDGVAAVALGDRPDAGSGDGHEASGSGSPGQGDSAMSGQLSGGLPGIANAGAQRSSEEDGVPGIATAPGSETDEAHNDQPGGVPPMAGGAGNGGQAADLQRGSSQWRTAGRLFDDGADEENSGFSRISDILGPGR